MPGENYVYSNYSFDVNAQQPIDKRFRISTISALNTELPLNKRYDGLIFYVRDTKNYYYFDNNLTVALPLNITQTLIFNVVSGTQNYSTLITDLNNTGLVIGKQVLVLPLNVVYIYTGSAWEYHIGTYTVNTTANFLTIPLTLRKFGKEVRIGATPNVVNLIKNDGTLGDYFESVATLPANPEHQKFYLNNGKYYYSVSNRYFELKSQTFQTNQNLTANTKLTITHNLNYVNSLFQIFAVFVDNIQPTKNIVTKIDYEYVDANSVIIEPKITMNNVTLFFVIQ